MPLSSLRAAAPAIAHPSTRHGTVDLDFDQFNYAFTNTLGGRGAARGVRPLRGAGDRADLLPGRLRELHAPRRDRGRLRPRGPRAAADHGRRARPHRPAVRSRGELPQVPRRAGDDRVRRVPRPLAPADGRRRLGDEVAQLHRSTGSTRGAAYGPRARRQGRRRHRRQQGHRPRGRRRRWPPRAPWSSPARADRRSTLEGVTARGGRPRRRRTARRARAAARSTSTAASTCWSTTSARVRLRLDGFLGTTDDGVRVGDADELLHRAAGDARRACRAMVEPGRRRDRQRRARSTPSSSPTAGTIDYGAAKAALLNLGKSLAQEFGAEGHPRQLRLARAGEHRPLARRARRGRDRRGRRGRRRRRPPASRSSRASAASPPGASRRPRRWRRSSSCSPRSARRTSPAPTTSSTAD